jgi:WD40 repeat protein
MKSDDFLKSLRSDVPEDFAKELYERLMREEQNVMLIYHNNTKEIRPATTRQTSRVVALAAMFTALLMCSVIFAGVPRTPNGQQLPLTLNNAVTITTENVQALQLIETVGRGTAESVSWSPDGETIAVAGSRGLHLHDARDLNTPTQLFGETMTHTTDVIYSPDSSSLAGIRDETLYIWDVKTALPLHQFQNIRKVLRFSTDATQIAGVAVDDSIQIWDVETGEVIKNFETTYLYQVELSGDFRWLAYNRFMGNSTVLIEVETGKKHEIVTGLLAKFALSDNGRWFAVQNPINDIRVWLYDLEKPTTDIRSARIGFVLNDSYMGEILVLKFLPHSTRLMAITPALANIRDVAAPKSQAVEFEVSSTLRNARSIAFKPDATQFAVTDHTGAIEVWSIESPELGNAISSPIVRFTDYSPSFHLIRFSMDDRQLVATGFIGTAWQWDLSDKTAVESTLFGESTDLSEGTVGDVIFTSDNGLFYTFISDEPGQNYFAIRDLETGNNRFQSLYLPPAAVFTVMQDGKVLSVSNDNAIHDWSVEIPPMVVPLEGAPDLNSFDKVQVAFSPDGRLLAGSVCIDRPESTPGNLCDGSELRVWEVKTGKLVRVLEGGDYPITQIAFTGDSRFVASNQCKSLRVTVAYLPECVEPRILLWDLSDTITVDRLKPIAELEGYIRGASALAFSPSSTGAELLLVSADGEMLKFWEISEGNPILLGIIQSSATTLAFNHAGTVLAAGGAGMVELWGTDVQGRE